MQIRLINRAEDLLLIRGAWNELFQEGDYSLFQSFEFNYYSWICELIIDKRNQLSVTIITEEEQIIAIFPFYVDSKRDLRFINDNHSDFCDYLRKEAINFIAVYDFLKQEIRFNTMSLINLKEESNIYKKVKDINIKDTVFLSKQEYSTLNIDKGIFPYNVPHYRSHQKHRINKAIRKHLQKETIVLMKDSNSFPKQEILLLKDKMIHSGIRKKDFMHNNRLLLIEDLYNSGIVTLNVMRDKDGFNAVNILLKGSSNSFMFWIDIFDETQMINLSAYCNVIKYFSSTESIDVNFGRGRYFYKESNFAPEFHKLHQILIFSSKWKKLWFFIVNMVRGKLISVYKKITQ